MFNIGDNGGMGDDGKPSPPKKVAFVFAGGGARGAIQVGMVRRVREKGIKPDIVTGNSIGAVNAFFVAQDKIGAMEDFWRAIKGNDDVYHKRWFASLFMFLGWQIGPPSLLKPGPMAKKLQAVVRARKRADFIAELRIGAVDLITGDFISINQDHPLLDRFILGSTAIPIAFPPLRIKKREDPELVGLYCDGCVRNLTPVSQAVSLGATELHIFLTGGKSLLEMKTGFRQWAELVDRVVSINMHELVVDDIERVLLASKAAAAGLLNGPVPQKPGLEVNVYHTSDAVLQGVLDFDPQAIADAIDLGYILADNPITTDVLLKDFATAEKGMPHGYYYVDSTGKRSVKVPYDEFIKERTKP